MANRPGEPIDRDAFYDKSGDDDEVLDLEDGGEYELEPVDPEVLASERERAQAEVIRAETSLDVDQVYREAESTGQLDEFFADFKFRFQVKHMLMGTAALAVFLSVSRLIGSVFAAFIVVATVGLIAAHAFLNRRDRQREAALAAKREKLVAMARAGEKGVRLEPEELGPLDREDAVDEDGLPDERAPLRIKFSVKEILVALTVASVMLGMLSLLGFSAVAAILGLIAIAGLVVFAVGVEMPPVAMLIWWITLVLYIVVSVAGAFFKEA